MPSLPRPAFVLPIGTQVVTRVAGGGANGAATVVAGTAAVVVEPPLDATHTYLLRTADGRELRLHRGEFAILSHWKHQQGLPSPDPLQEHQLARFVIYRCVVGSRAFGLAGADSDFDRRGIYLPPAELHWSLASVPDQLEFDASQEVYWELQRFLVLALKANPNLLECLWTPLVEHATPIAQELLALREAFLSRLVHQTYGGYVLSQFRKLEQDLRTHGSPRWKHAMHLLRLLLSGITLLREGRVRVDVGPWRERLLAVKAGQLAWDEVDGWRRELQQEFDEAALASPLPERPDYAKVDAFLLRARRAQVDIET